MLTLLTIDYDYCHMQRDLGEGSPFQIPKTHSNSSTTGSRIQRINTNIKYSDKHLDNHCTIRTNLFYISIKW